MCTFYDKQINAKKYEWKFGSVQVLLVGDCTSFSNRFPNLTSRAIGEGKPKEYPNMKDAMLVERECSQRCSGPAISWTGPDRH